jgi:hypothetical protein
VADIALPPRGAEPSVVKEGAGLHEQVARVEGEDEHGARRMGDWEVTGVVRQGMRDHSGRMIDPGDGHLAHKVPDGGRAPAIAEGEEAAIGREGPEVAVEQRTTFT